MKQLLFLLLISMFSIGRMSAQTNQPPKEMIQQIVALKAFLNYTRQGYNIVSGGLRIVNNIKAADFRLHDMRFDQLKQVSPAVKRSASFLGIAGMQLSLISRCHKLLLEAGQNNVLTTDERKYCKQILLALLDECKGYADVFLQVLTANELALTDDERLKRLLQVQQQLIRLESSLGSFNEDFGVLIRQRMNEQRSLQFSKQLNKLQ